jgi:polyisoprenoid-binding protein YceI
MASTSVPMLGQGKYLANNGFISFFSHTAIEDIRADNSLVASVIDSESGELAIIVTMTNFQFEKKLMQEHFNENYVESEKYPKATFNGKIVNNSEVDYSSKGEYSVQVEGEMTIHGVTKEVSIEGKIVVSETGDVLSRAKFPLNPEDYDIKIPRLVRKNIAERMAITVDILHKPI